MLIQTSGAAPSTPGVGTANIYTDTNGFLNVKKSDGSTKRIAGHKLELLPDVTGPFTSGHVPAYDGSTFRSTSPSAPIYPAVNITSSGVVNVEVLLNSNTLGSAQASIIFSGIPLDYDYLEVRIMGHNANPTGAHVVSCNFDNDTADLSRYRTTNLRGDEFVWYGQNVADAGCGTIHAADKNDGGQGDVNPIHFYIPFYGRNGNRKWLYGVPALWRHDNGIAIQGYICQWLQFTAPIGMLTFRIQPSAAANLDTGTTIQVYGHKKQWVVLSGTIGSNAVRIDHGLLAPPA